MVLAMKARVSCRASTAWRRSASQWPGVWRSAAAWGRSASFAVCNYRVQRCRRANGSVTGGICPWRYLTSADFSFSMETSCTILAVIPAKAGIHLHGSAERVIPRVSRLPLKQVSRLSTEFLGHSGAKRRRISPGSFYIPPPCQARDCGALGIVNVT